jgi:hypothetical protein
MNATSPKKNCWVCRQPVEHPVMLPSKGQILILCGAACLDAALEAIGFKRGGRAACDAGRKRARTETEGDIPLP